MNRQKLDQKKQILSFIFLAVIVVSFTNGVATGLWTYDNYEKSRNYFLECDYSINWSGTTADQYRVNDQSEGDITCKGSKSIVNNEVTVEGSTDSTDSLHIKITINIEDPSNPFISSYKIKADYSYKSESNCQIYLPATISGSGHGLYDWQDSWTVNAEELIDPIEWTMKETVIAFVFISSLTAFGLGIIAVTVIDELDELKV